MARFPSRSKEDWDRLFRSVRATCGGQVNDLVVHHVAMGFGLTEEMARALLE